MVKTAPAGDFDELSRQLRAAYGKFPRRKARRRKTSRSVQIAAEFSLELDGIAPVAATYDWRDHVTITPARNQLPYNTCASFSIAAVIEAMTVIGGGAPVTVDPGFIHTCLGHGGAYPDPEVDGRMPLDLDYALGLVQQSGYVVGPEPYPFPAANCPAAAPRKKIRLYTQLAPGDLVSKQAALKSAIVSRGPVVSEMYFYQDFFDLRDTEQPYAPSPDSHGPIGHVITIVGYTNIGWIIKNSFGPAWGRHGFAVVRFGDCGISGLSPSTIGECRTFSLSL